MASIVGPQPFQVNLVGFKFFFFSLIQKYKYHFSLQVELVGDNKKLTFLAERKVLERLQNRVNYLD